MVWDEEAFFFVRSNGYGLGDGSVGLMLYCILTLVYDDRVTAMR